MHTNIALFLQQYPVFVFLVVALFSLAIGSFLNVIIHRLPRMMKRQWFQQCQDFLKEYPEPDKLPKVYHLALPRSHCPQCQRLIPWYANIPLLSFLYLRGKCGHCQALIPWRYPLMELSTMLLSLFLLWHFGVSLKALMAILLTWGLLTLFFIDLEHQLLPDSFTLPLLWLGLLVNTQQLFVPLSDAVWGCVAGYLVLFLIATGFKWVTKRDGMGHGDFKLLALLGAWLGWQTLPLIILLSSLLGAVVGILLIVFRGANGRTAIAFGPYLALAGWVALTWGAQLIPRYWPQGL